jgi:hypothetical protein
MNQSLSQPNVVQPLLLFNAESVANYVYAQLELPDGTTFCTIDCAFADVNNPCVVRAECPLQSPLPDYLPACESDADCFGGHTSRDASGQWPAAMP